MKAIGLLPRAQAFGVQNLKLGAAFVITVILAI